jgi:hypothetical protein
VLALPIAKRSAIHARVIVVFFPQPLRYSHFARISFAPLRQLFLRPMGESLTTVTY